MFSNSIGDSVLLKQQHDIMKNRLAEVYLAYKELRENYDKLGRQLTSLTDKYDSLSSNYNATLSSWTTAGGGPSDLAKDNQKLTSEFDEYRCLQTKKENQLQAAHKKEIKQLQDELVRLNAILQALKDKGVSIGDSEYKTTDRYKYLGVKDAKLLPGELQADLENLLLENVQFKLMAQEIFEESAQQSQAMDQLELEKQQLQKKNQRLQQENRQLRDQLQVQNSHKSKCVSPDSKQEMPKKSAEAATQTSYAETQQFWRTDQPTRSFSTQPVSEKSERGEEGISSAYR